MGVWKQTGHTYKLSHYAQSWDGSGANLIGPANIRERVRMGPGNDRYSGTFTLDQFDTVETCWSTSLRTSAGNASLPTSLCDFRADGPSSLPQSHFDSLVQT